MKSYVIIVAGGKGLRMQSQTPKQFLLLNNKPIIYYSIKKFFDTFKDINCILVLPLAHLDFGEALKKLFPEHNNISIVEGGEERFHSVKNGLQTIPSNEEALVFIHDAVRPFVSSLVLKNAFAQATLQGNAIPVIELKDSIRKITTEENVGLKRSEYKLVQTPQVFNNQKIQQAYATLFDESFTDDASVFEKAGNKIVTIEGNKENIKITTPEDLILASYYLENNI